jgi:hypothetical protein
MMQKNRLLKLDAHQLIDAIAQGAISAQEVRTSGVEYSYFTNMVTQYLNEVLSEEGCEAEAWENTRLT